MRHSLVWLRPRDETLRISQGRTVLLLSRAGWIEDGQHGLLVHETRLLSRYRVLIDGRQPYPVSLSNVEQHSWLGYYIERTPGVDYEQDHGSGQVAARAQQTLELRVSRHVGEGLHEDLDLTNFTQSATTVTLELEVDADFADLLEMQGDRQQQGLLSATWQAGPEGSWGLRYDYRASGAPDRQEPRAAGLHRATEVELANFTSPPIYASGRIRFEVVLPPGGRWHTCLNVRAEIDGVRLPLAYRCKPFTQVYGEYDRRRMLFLGGSTSFSTPESHTLAPIVIATLERARRDLAALRLFDLDRDDRTWTVAAGLPIYVALFGRDTLTAAWQAALLSPDPLRGTALEMPRWQGRRHDDWRDEQPGRMLHEAHTGPLEALDYNPRARYYGSATTSAFFPFIVSALWHWTGDRALVSELLDPALSALEWLDRHGDLDGDGFYEYRTRSPQGVRNQAWKDSADAIVHADGTQVEPPIATCEEQAFAYAAKLHLAEVLLWLGRRGEARRLFREARALKRRFNEAFWMEDEGFLAMGLDSQKRQIRSIASNAGHCIASGIVASARVRRIAERLMAPDLFSGWGVRTLSSGHPAYNPYSYHRGSVWPVEQGTFALGLMRYGLYEPMHRLVRAQFEAAALFDFHRLPEAFSGHPRDGEHPFPAIYPQSNSPQAWSASAVICMLQALLGIYPYAPGNLLVVDPRLPEWLPDIAVSDLRVGDATATLAFRRDRDGSSSYRVIEKRGRLRVVRQPSPWSLTATYRERALDFVASLAPGR